MRTKVIIHKLITKELNLFLFMTNTVSIGYCHILISEDGQRLDWFLKASLQDTNYDF